MHVSLSSPVLAALFDKLGVDLGVITAALHRHHEILSQHSGLISESRTALLEKLAKKRIKVPIVIEKKNESVRPRPISLDQPESDTSTSLVPKELLLKEQEETRRLKEKCQRLEHELALERKERRRIADVLLSKLELSLGTMAKPSTCTQLQPCLPNGPQGASLETVAASHSPLQSRVPVVPQNRVSTGAGGGSFVCPEQPDIPEAPISRVGIGAGVPQEREPCTSPPPRPDVPLSMPGPSRGMGSNPTDGKSESPALALEATEVPSFTIEGGRVHLGHGIFLTEDKWLWIMKAKTDSLFCKEGMRALWSPEELFNRSVTGAPCKRLIKEGATGRRALSPVKLHALENAYERYLKDNEGRGDVQKRKKQMRRHMSELLADINRRSGRS